jgi:hypothetical protein
LVKQRIARPRQGRSGGFRAVLFFRQGDKAVFLHLFAKSRTNNLTAAEEDWYREFAEELALLPEARVRSLAESSEWIEIRDESKDKEVPE